MEAVKYEERKDSLENQVSKLRMEENFAYIDLPNMIEKNPEQIKFTMIDDARERIGNYGSMRVDLIKNAFKTIIDNIVCGETKAIIAILNHMPVRKWVAISKENKRTKKDKYKLKEDSDKSNIYNCVENLYFSDTIVERWENWGRDYKIEIDKLKRIVRKLIRTRNKIFKILKITHEFFYSSKIYEGYQKQDYVTVCEMANWFKGTPFVQAHELYEIPKKATNRDEYKDDELTIGGS